MKNIRIAAITCPSHLGQIDRNLAQTAAWTRKAKQAGAGLVCFPELNITGYCNRPEMARIAQSIPGRASDELIRLAADEDIIILAGMAQSNHGGLAYASHCVFSPDGNLAVYRKIHIAPPEKQTFAAGNTIPVFQAGGITFGIQLCFDAHFPELAAAMTAKGAEVIFIPHASPRGNAEEKHTSWMRHLTARAYDNSVFIVACNQIGENCNGLAFPGNALVIGPAGEVLAKDTRPRASMLLADLNAADLDAVRNHPMRHFFRHRRPDLYYSTLEQK
ncbi:MAG: nitrilase-related carbon-nitrogen hydrolase [Desulfobacteraceae bacterium]|jgi:predicted amidohydrolase